MAGPMLADLNIRHKKVNAAIDEIITATALTGALQREGLVSVTMQSISDNEAQLLDAVQSSVSSAVSHQNSIEIDVFTVDNDTREAAHDLHISPAKYLAILDLQEVDPSATVDECINHSIGEIRQRTQAHGGGKHHGNNDNDGDAADNNSPGENADDAENSESNSPGHHGVDNNNSSENVGDARNNESNPPWHHGEGNGKGKGNS